MNKFLLLAFWFVGCVSYGQTANPLRVEPSFGISFRTAPFLFFNYNYSERVNLRYRDYNPETNFQGLSIEPELRLMTTNSKWSCHLTPMLRYDDTFRKVTETDSSYSSRDIKELIFEPHFSITYKFFQNIEAGIGYTQINLGKGYKTAEGQNNSIQFPAWNLVVEGYWKKYSWFVRSYHILRKQMPGHPKDDYYSLAVGVSYRFNVLEIEK